MGLNPVIEISRIIIKANLKEEHGNVVS